MMRIFIKANLKLKAAVVTGPNDSLTIRHIDIHKSGFAVVLCPVAIAIIEHNPRNDRQTRFCSAEFRLRPLRDLLPECS